MRETIDQRLPEPKILEASVHEHDGCPCSLLDLVQLHAVCEYGPHRNSGSRRRGDRKDHDSEGL
jgi:hypothetical protein